MLQPSNARLLQTKSWQSCPGVVVQLYRRHVVQRHHAEWVLLPLPFVLLAQVALGIFTAKLPADSNLYRRAMQLITVGMSIARFRVNVLAKSHTKRPSGSRCPGWKAWAEDHEIKWFAAKNIEINCSCPEWRLMKQKTVGTGSCRWLVLVQPLC